MKTHVQFGCKTHVINATQMKDGDIGYIVSGSYKGKLVIKTHDHIINLDNVAYSWGSPYPDFQVKLLLSGSKVILEVE